MSKNRGLLINFEGLVDLVKTIQIQKLVDLKKQQNQNAGVIRFPSRDTQTDLILKIVQILIQLQCQRTSEKK